MAQQVIGTETIRYWLQQLESRFRPSILQRGYEDATQNKVSSVFVEDGTLRAFVSGSAGQVYAVKLDQDFFGISSCSCSMEYCKHMVAVMLRGFELAGLNIHAVVQELSAIQETAAGKSDSWKQELKQNKPMKRRAGSQQPSRAESLANKSLEHDAPASEWKQWLKRHMGQHASRSALTSTRQHLMQSIDKTVTQWPEQPAILLELYAELLLMQAADELARKFDVQYNVSYNGSSIDQLVQIGMAQIDSLAERIDGQLLYETHPDHIQLLKEELGNHPFAMSTASIDWLLIYRLLWWRVFQTPKLVRAECERLQEMQKNKRMIAQKRELVQCAEVHFMLLGGEDDRAQDIIKSMQYYGTPQWWQFYLLQFWREQTWDRLIFWLRWLLPYIASIKKDQDLLTAYIELWKRTAAHVDCEDEWREVLLRLLPASFYAYEQFLIERRQYQTWVDLILSVGMSYDEISDETMRKIETHDPASLLPILHQAIAHHISLKNREDYRMAVKILKHLKQLYERLDRVEVWTDYFSQFMERYNRLRSLQDELRKGGLRR